MEHLLLGGGAGGGEELAGTPAPVLGSVGEKVGSEEVKARYFGTLCSGEGNLGGGSQPSSLEGV